jgi:hypothetical protein
MQEQQYRHVAVEVSKQQMISCKVIKLSCILCLILLFFSVAVIVQLHAIKCQNN